MNRNERNAIDWVARLALGELNRRYHDLKKLDLEQSELDSRLALLAADRERVRLLIEGGGG